MIEYNSFVDKFKLNQLAELLKVYKNIELKIKPRDQKDLEKEMEE